MGWPPLGALAPSREAALSPHRPVGPTGQPAASTWMLSLLSVLAPQPEAEEGAPAPGPVPEQTSQWKDPAPCGDPAALDGALPLLHHPPRTWRTRPTGVGTGERQSRVTPQGQPRGEESQILATQSGASSLPSPGASSRRPSPCPHIPTSTLSPGPQTPFPAPFPAPPGVPRLPPPPYLQASKAAPLLTPLANPGEARDSSAFSAPRAADFGHCVYGIPTPKRGLG